MPLLLLVMGLLVAGCDSGGALDDGDNDPESESVIISGQATDDQASDGSKSAKAGVEGATVTAVSVHADGTTTVLDGEATTDANGTFSLEVEGDGASGIVRVDVEGNGDYASSAIVVVDGQSQVETQPLTVETSAEADVYVEAKGDASGSEEHHEGVTLADVAAYVEAEAAADIEAGATSVTDVAAAIRNAVEAEAAYHSEAESSLDAGALATAKHDAYAQLQADLAAAADADARAAAVASFEETMGALHTDAGASVQAQAEGRQAGTALLIEFSAEASSDAEVGLRRQAELLRAYATARANEAVFEAEGAAESSLDALADARNTLLAEIRAAADVEAIAAAKADYETTVEEELQASFDVDATLIASAKGSTDPALSTLADAFVNLDLLLGSAIDTAVNAYADFYADAQQAAETALDSSADTEACATVIVTLAAF